MRRALFVGVLIVGLLAGCATTWPEACAVSDGLRRCKCAVIKFAIDKHPTAPSPAGVVSVDCDGKKLPIEAHAMKVSK